MSTARDLLLDPGDFPREPRAMAGVAAAGGD